MPASNLRLTPSFIAAVVKISLRPQISSFRGTTPLRTYTTYRSPLGHRRSQRTPTWVRPICSASTSHAPTTTRLAELREELQSRGVFAFIVPSGDPHNSEYAPNCYGRRAFISDFNGSAGTAVVTLDAAYLWTDGRYFLQAEKQLDSNWTLMRAGLPETPTIPDFLAENVPKGAAVGIDPFVHSIEAAKRLREALEEAGSRLVSFEAPNPVDMVWGTGRPAFPKGIVRLHDDKYAGQSVGEKLAFLRQEMEENKCEHMLLSMLDESCWVFNIRGTDIQHCPVVLSYALVSKEHATLYVDESKLTSSVRDGLRKAGVIAAPYDDVLKDVRGLAERGEKIWLDPASTSLALSAAASESALRETTPVQMAKACKNEIEIRGMRDSHIRDGVALSSFLCWLEDHVNSGDRTISEVEAASKLEEFRAAQSKFVSLSFGTIPGSGANGAVIHYSPAPETCGQVSSNEVFLLDSGGQYDDGTTDVTRTMHLGGKATEHEKECFTRVLQGHIAIDKAVFPEGTTGMMLDTLARVPLWSIGLDYRHGTGHGVGAYLNVHEGPQSISPRIGSNKVGIKEGMILSNEPGYYEDGNFGIRIENLLCVIKKNTAHEFGGKPYLGFERLTHVPMDKSMINPSLLSAAEIEWLDSYHTDVWRKLSPHMDGRYKEWLREKTMPLLRKETHSSDKVESAVTAAS